MHVKALASNRLTRANRASHGPRVRAKERVKRTRENLKESLQEPKVPKGCTKVKHRKLVYQVLKNSKSETTSDTQESAETCPTDTSWNDGWNGDQWNDGWSFDEWNDDCSSVGWHEGWEQTYDTSGKLIFTWRIGCQCRQQFEAV